jgi:hypothetical protein
MLLQDADDLLFREPAAVQVGLLPVGRDSSMPSGRDKVSGPKGSDEPAREVLVGQKIIDLINVTYHHIICALFL